VRLVTSGLSAALRSPSANEAHERNVWMLVRLSVSEVRSGLGVSRLIRGLSESGMVSLGRGRPTEGEYKVTDEPSESITFVALDMSLVILPVNGCTLTSEAGDAGTEELDGTGSSDLGKIGRGSGDAGDGGVTSIRGLAESGMFEWIGSNPMVFLESQEGEGTTSGVSAGEMLVVGGT
jgi:hypothetical protein